MKSNYENVMKYFFLVGYIKVVTFFILVHSGTFFSWQLKVALLFTII